MLYIRGYSGGKVMDAALWMPPCVFVRPGGLRHAKRCRNKSGTPAPGGARGNEPLRRPPFRPLLRRDALVQKLQKPRQLIGAEMRPRVVRVALAAKLLPLGLHLVLSPELPGYGARLEKRMAKRQSLSQFFQTAVSSHN